MHKSILVLEESRMVHELFESALPEDYTSWEVNHESLPDRYLQKAEETNPDIIFLSNQDQKRNYKTVKQLKSSPVFSQTPILLLTSAKDRLDENHLQSIGIRGFVRKPFETSTLQKQINVVLKEEEQKNKDSHEDRLKDLNVVDDDLMDLLSGQNKPQVSLDDLEGELDPTLQLIPEDPTEDEDEAAETELMSMDDSDDLNQAEFIDDEIDTNLDLDSEISFEMDDDEDIELEELDDESDFMDLDDDNMTAIDLDPDDQPIQSIKIVEGDSSKLRAPLQNTPENKNDLGFMEIHVMPLRGDEIKSHVVETISEDFDEEEFVKQHSPAELEDDFMSADSDIIMDITQEGNGDIEIPHEEIIEDFYEGDDIEGEDEDGLLELSIEGMDGELASSPAEDSLDEEVVAFEELEDSEDSIEELNIQDMDLPTETDDMELVSLDEQDEEDDDFTTVEQEDDDLDFSVEDSEEEVDVEIDFHNASMSDTANDDDPQPVFSAFDEEDIDEDSMTASELEKRRSDQLDVELEEIAAAGSEEASATIQEMIGFRQVMKAKYDLPDDDIDTEIEPMDEEDDFDDLIGEDEDLFSEVENSLEEGESLLEDHDSLSDFPGDDDDSLMEDITEDEDSELLAELPDDEEDNTFLTDFADDEGTLLENDSEDEFSPLLDDDLEDDAVEDDDVELLAELPDDISPSMEDDSAMLEELSLETEDPLLEDIEEEESFQMEELTDDDDTPLFEEMDEPDTSPLMEDDSTENEFTEGDDDLLLDVAESAEDEIDDLELLTNEIDEDSDSSDLALLNDENEDDDEKLDDIDLFSDFGDEENPVIESSTTDEVLDDDDTISDDDLADDMFEEPSDALLDDNTDEVTAVDAEEDVFDSTMGEDILMDPMDLADIDSSEPTSTDESDADLEEPFEEIELLSDSEPVDESESLLQVDEEMDEDIDDLVIDDEDTEEEANLEAPDELLAMEDQDDFDISAAGSMEDIDFLPIDEDSDEDDIELEVEIDDTSEDNMDFHEKISDSDDDSLDDIDFLPVDEEEANISGEEIEDIPVVGLVDEESEDEINSLSDIDFLPDDSDQQESENDMTVAADSGLEQDLADNSISSIDDSDEVTIEVPQETFEMNDFNIGDITSDDAELDETSQDMDDPHEEADLGLMEGIDTVSAEESEEAEESYDDLELPTMDEDLPDLPPILGESEDEDKEEDSLDVFDEDTSEESDIKLMQAKSDFADFDSEQEIIGVTEDSNVSANPIPDLDRDKLSQQVHKAAASLTPEFRKKLSVMIEGVVSETVHNTLQEKLPELVDKLMNEEMQD